MGHGDVIRMWILMSSGLSFWSTAVQPVHVPQLYLAEVTAWHKKSVFRACSLLSISVQNLIKKLGVNKDWGFVHLQVD